MNIVANMIAPLLPYIVLVVASVAAILGYGRHRAKSAERAIRDELENADHEFADDIRSRVERNRDQRVRDYDDAGWRD